MKYLLFVLLAITVHQNSLGQGRPQSKTPSKIAVLIRGGFTVPEDTDPRGLGTVSIQHRFDFGLSAGLGVGLSRNDILDMTAMPVFLDLTHLGALDKFGPIISMHAGYLVGNKTMRAGNQAITYKGGLLIRGLVGVKFPFKNGKFSFIQGGYGQQTIKVINTASNYGEWVAVIGFKL